MARPKVVITGGAGFIGSHIADALVARTEVVAADHLKAGKRANLDGAMKAGAVLRTLDILRGHLRPIVRGAEVVYHFAANPAVRLGRDGTKPPIDATVVGGRSGHGVVVDFVRKLSRDPKELETLGSEPGTAKSYIHIEDVVAAIEAGTRAADEPVSVFNVGSEDAITVRSLADAICDELGLSGVEYRWTGGAGNGRGWAGYERWMPPSNE